MTKDIEAIFIDLGNTLRILLKDEVHMARARQEIVRLLETKEDPLAFCEKLNERYKVYRKWAFENLAEAPEAELWTRWLAPEFPVEKVAPFGAELTYQFRQSMGRRVLVDGGKEVVAELHERGYTLGIISNLIGTREIPDWMEAEGFTAYFKSVVLSSVFGKRKPDPAIYFEAAHRAGVEPAKCAYIGDNLKRDVTGTRAAGFGMLVIMISPEELAEATITDENRPDIIIHEFRQLLEVFPRAAGLSSRVNLLIGALMSTGHSPRGATALAEGVKALYAEGQTDYSFEPLVIVDNKQRPLGRVANGDAVIFCCRRGEREIQLTEAFTEPGFDRFARPGLPDLTFVILTLYHEKFKDLPVAFAPSKIPETLGEIISCAGLRQYRTAESEKFPHITFFFNGGNNQAFAGQDGVRIPSPKGIPFDQVPELSLPQVTEQVVLGIEKKYDFIVTNFANGDVIGHTANNEAKIRCASIVDHRLGQVVDAARAAGYVTLITADHGNLELMTTPDGAPHVAHTSNLVNFILIDPAASSTGSLLDGKLADVAPTILSALGLEQPALMDGATLAPGYDWGGKRRVLLIILDGWGIGKNDATNPIFLAQTPVWDELTRRYLSSRLQASGEAVGLQAGKAGNSEAGHMNIGAGRVVSQDDVRLDLAMKDGSFFTNETFLHVMEDVKQRGTSLHLLGLLTEKSSHGSIDYPLAILKMAKERGLKNVYLHVIFDGRSTEPGSAPALLATLEAHLNEIGIGQVVTGVGRGIALDRDGNYGKTKRAFDALVHGVGKACPLDQGVEHGS